jgi:hypothetical protein
MLKLSKALYFKHNGTIFDGVIYANHINIAASNTTPEYLNDILKMAPALADIKRNRQSLAEQFIYRFNHSPTEGVMYAVVQFGHQFVFQLIAMSRQMDAKLVAMNQGVDLSKVGRYECFISVPFEKAPPPPS